MWGRLSAALFAPVLDRLRTAATTAPRTAALLALFALSLAAAPHPLAPLSAAEIRAAARILKAYPQFPRAARFSQLTLAEPPKDQVLRNAAPPRRAFAILYDMAGNRTFQAIANLADSRVESWKEIPGVQPAVGQQDSDLADRIVRADPRFARALAGRGIADPDQVIVMSWTAGYFGLPGTEKNRIVCAVPYSAAWGSNFYGHPIEGIVAHVDLTTRKIIDFVDIDRATPVPRDNFDFTPAATRPWRPPAAPLHITQPDGAGFHIEDGEVRWEKWRFRYALHPREGLVLYTVGYEDGGRVRPVMYRGSLSEMLVPYGDPGAAWYFRNSFDAGELGIGSAASPLHPGADCPQNCTVYDAVLAGETGEPETIPGAVAIYELDGGIAWKHAGNTRRARDLVVSFLSQPGNYEYGFDWVFHQDGTLEMRVSLTGIMAVKSVAADPHDAHGHMVGRNVDAVHHQHFFNFRLDLDVDGAPNRALEMNSTPMPAGPRNPWGNGFTMVETPLLSERQAQRNINLQTSRRWIIENPSARNPLGHPTGYALLPGENAVPFARPDSWVRKRAGFLNAHVWVTPYDPAEIYAAGDYPNQSQGGDGLPRWTAADRSLDGKDLVLWYTMGITHNPRPEDWPVMPVYQAGFKLVPWGFFAKNPALDLPPVK
jgi:primary-amine oxidase